MHADIEAFRRYMEIERNASELTLKSYSEDLASLLVYFSEQLGSILEVHQVTINVLRGYQAYLHECQYARTTIARRLRACGASSGIVRGKDASIATRRSCCGRRASAESCRTS